MNKTVSSTEASGAWRMIYDWPIENFSLLPQKLDEFIYSPEFSAGPNKEMWSLDLYPQGNKKAAKDQVSLYLQLASSAKFGTTLRITFWIIKLDKIIAEKTMVHKYDEAYGRGYRNFTCRSDLIKAAKSDPFVIRCDISSITPPIDVSFTANPNQLIEDLRSLFETSKLSDVTIIVGDEKFKAHKSVLAARSEVFAAMFEHKEMVENIKNEVKIEDIEPVAVKALLEYLYTGEVDNLKMVAIGLLPAAHKYELVGLQEMCAKILKDIVDQENAIKILILADLYSVGDLKLAIMKLVEQHFSIISQTEDYKKLKDSELLKELLSYCVRQKS